MSATKSKRPVGRARWDEVAARAACQESSGMGAALHGTFARESRQMLDGRMSMRQFNLLPRLRSPIAAKFRYNLD